jgi:hypothetical protein
MGNTVVRRDKRVRLLFITGMLLICLASFLNTHTQFNDFIRGLIDGIGLGLLILFVWRIKKEDKNSTENRNA